jgi:hypothetical protein
MPPARASDPAAGNGTPGDFRNAKFGSLRIRFKGEVIARREHERHLVFQFLGSLFLRATAFILRHMNFDLDYYILRLRPTG